MDDFLPKPFTKETLVPMLHKWLDGRKPQSPVGLAPAEADLEVWDLDRAVEVFVGDRDVVMGLLATFPGRIGEQLGRIRQALKDADLEIIAQEAHSIKGGALNFQARQLGELASSLEHSARHDTPIGDMQQLLEELVEAHKRFAAVAARHQPKLAANPGT